MRKIVLGIAAITAMILVSCGLVEQIINQKTLSGKDESVFETYAAKECTLEYPNKQPQKIACDRLQLYLDAEGKACASSDEQPTKGYFPDKEKPFYLCRNHLPEMAEEDTVRFIVFGDVGAGQDGEFGHQQLRVAQAMQAVCPPKSVDPKNGCDFALITGDLIYPDGVSDVWDGQFVSKFEQMYSPFGDKFKFYAVTGNHDYRGNVTAQIEYSYLSKLWYMPERHYAVPNLPSWLRIYGLDTNPISDGEDEEAQLAAAKDYLCKKDGWHMVFGHHPAVSHGRHGHNPDMARWYDKLGQACALNVVFSGHDHNQQHLVTNQYDQIIQGAGGYETHNVNEDGEDSSITLDGDRDLIHTQKFAKERHGFAMVEATKDSLIINFYDIHRWDYGVLRYKEKPQASEFLYRCKKIPGANCEAF